MQYQLEPKQRVASAAIVVLLALAAAHLWGAEGAVSPALAVHPKHGPSPAMRLVITDPMNACVGAVCQIGTNESFTLGVEIVTAPGAGYLYAGSYVHFGPDLSFDPGSSAPGNDFVWPDCSADVQVRFQDVAPQAIDPPPDSDVLAHGCATSLEPPLPISEYEGLFVSFELSCSSAASSNPIELFPLSFDPTTPQFTSGTAFTPSDAPNLRPHIAEVTSLIVNCVAPAPAPAAVGGISLDSELRPLPLETTAGSGSSPWAIAAGVAAVCLAAAAGAAWYARRR